MTALTSPTAPAGVPVQLDRDRRLILDMRALGLAERRMRELTGDRTLSGFELANRFATTALIGFVGVTELTVLVWAALLREDPAITEDAVMALVKPKNVKPLVAALATAFNAEFDPEEKGDQAGQSPAAPFPPGSGAGPSPGSPAA